MDTSKIAIYNTHTKKIAFTVFDTTHSDFFSCSVSTRNFLVDALLGTPGKERRTV